MRNLPVADNHPGAAHFRGGFILLQQTNENSRADFSSGVRDPKRAPAGNKPQVALSKPPAPRAKHKLRRVARRRADSGPALP